MDDLLVRALGFALFSLDRSHLGCFSDCDDLLLRERLGTFIAESTIIQSLVSTIFTRRDSRHRLLFLLKFFQHHLMIFFLKSYKLGTFITLLKLFR